MDCLGCASAGAPPQYQPAAVYGPTYAPPPQPYYPSFWTSPAGVATTGLIGFGGGIATGMLIGSAFNWGSNDVDIDVNRNTNINNNIDRSKAQQNINNRQSNRQQNGAGANRGNNSWSHDPKHRQGVPYRDQKTASQYGRNDRQAAQSRYQFRGRADAGRQDLARGGASDFRGTGGNFGSSGAGAGNRTPGFGPGPRDRVGKRPGRRAGR